MEAIRSRHKAGTKTGSSLWACPNRTSVRLVQKARFPIQTEPKACEPSKVNRTQFVRSIELLELPGRPVPKQQPDFVEPWPGLTSGTFRRGRLHWNGRLSR